MDLPRPTVFIGSSTEALDVVRAVEYNLQDYADATAWTEVRSGHMQSVLEMLVDERYKYDFAVMVLAPDDQISKRGESHYVSRDNVIFELGLFIGRLGRERTFILQAEGHQIIDAVELPSDLRGIMTYRYRRRENLRSALRVPCDSIIESMRIFGSSQEYIGSSKDHDEPGLLDKVIKLRLKLLEADFLPDLIIGISRGGLPVAALLSRRIGGAAKVPVMSLSRHPGFENSFNSFSLPREAFPAGDTVRILIVDDVCKRGKTLSDALSFIERSIDFTDVEMATAALTSSDDDSDRVFNPTFSVETNRTPVNRFGGGLE
jgi:hypoxanthine phosphoribosyltransferase